MLPAATISSAVDAALAANASLTVVRVELILAATNWLGHTNESSAARPGNRNSHVVPTSKVHWSLVNRPRSSRRLLFAPMAAGFVQCWPQGRRVAVAAPMCWQPRLCLKWTCQMCSCRLWSLQAVDPSAPTSLSASPLRQGADT